MTLSEYAKVVEKFTVDNSPTILTTFGVVGTVATAVLTAKATFKAAEILAEELAMTTVDYEMPAKDKVNFVWKQYIPPVVTGVLTVTVIIAANQVGNRRAAAVAAAYSLSEKAFSEYREKVAEKLGANKEQAVRDEIAQDRVNNDPASNKTVIITGGEVLCYEAFTGRYFMSSMEALKKAQNDLNYKINNDYYASVSDFYNMIGLPPTAASEELGWNCDKLLELRFSTVLSDDGRPCISFEFDTVPIRNYYRIN